MREAYGKKDKGNPEPKPRHCCGMGFKEGLGHSDLDLLVTNPQDLKFTIGKSLWTNLRLVGQNSITTIYELEASKSKWVNADYI